MSEDDRGPVRGYRDLDVYRRAYQLALAVHKESVCFRESGYHTIGDQLRGAAWSVPANIAEGYGRKVFEKDFKRFLVTALGSANEMEVFLDAAKDLGWLDTSRHGELRAESEIVGKQLFTLIQKWGNH